LFNREEVKKLNYAVPELYVQNEACNVWEKGSQVVRTNFSAHLYFSPLAGLGRHPRVVKLVGLVFGAKLYMQ